MGGLLRASRMVCCFEGEARGEEGRAGRGGSCGCRDERSRWEMGMVVAMWSGDYGIKSGFGCHSEG